MMKRLLVLIYKDLLLLVRDRAGLIFLFVMPAVLVLVMTGMQKGAVDSTTSKSVSLVVLDADKQTIGETVVNELLSQDMFDIHLADSTLTGADIQQMVRKGQYKIGVFIPENTTAKLEDNLDRSFVAIFEGISQNDMEGQMDSVKVNVYLDPAINATFRTVLMCQLREASFKIEKKFMLDMVSEMVSMESADAMNIQPIGIEEVPCSPSALKGKVSVTDHNVPAWTLFAIFFIVISLSGGVIKEREDGVLARLMTMPCPYSIYLLSKVIVYELVCFTQFLMVMLMGKYLFPLVGLPAFGMHGTALLCFTVVFFAALSAIGFGLLISTFATTHQQAALFGAVSVVVFSAIGGIWVPTFLMPGFLRAISVVSPLNWGIEAFYDVLLRDGSWKDIAVECLYMFLFALACFGVSVTAKGVSKK